jgi:hypothetical protein
MFGFVFASMISQPDGNYIVERELSEGWNIVAGTIPEEGILADSDIQLSDISAVWYYSPKFTEYIRVYPDPELSKLQEADDDIVLTSSMWIHSKREGIIKYSTLEDYPSLENRQLYSGWNFVTITPDMTVDVNTATPEEEADYVLDAMKGDCDWTEIYSYWKEAGQTGWGDLLNNPNFVDKEALDDSLQGMGLVIKVNSDCKLGRSSSGGAIPPSLPA